MNPSGLSSGQIEQYRRDGFLVVPRVFTPAECDAWVDHFMAIHDGRTSIRASPSTVRAG